MQGDRAGQWIGWHCQDCVKGLPGLIPIAGVMAIKFTQVSQRSGIGWVHAVGFCIERLGLLVVRRVLGLQALLHSVLDLGALGAIEDRRIGNFSYIIRAQLLQFLGGVFRFLRKEAFLFQHGAVNGDGAGAIAGLGSLLGLL